MSEKEIIYEIRDDKIAVIKLNRPKKLNALTFELFEELDRVVQEVQNHEKEVRVIVLTSSSEHFCAGIDMQSAMKLGEVVNAANDDVDVARVAFVLQKMIDKYQKNFTALEKCRVPIICAITGYSIGVAMDIITACDIRICSKDTKFTVKEVDIGFCSDIGVIQRFPKVVGNDSWAREMIYTGRFFDAQEALKNGLVSAVTNTKEECYQKAMEIAKTIAEKSPVAMATIKQNINYSRDHTVQEGLEHILLLNMTMLQTKDMARAVMANFSKQKPEFPKL